MVIVKVFMNREAQTANQRMLERRISWDSSIKFPPEETVRTMKMLFGSDAIIVFEFD